MIAMVQADKRGGIRVVKNSKIAEVYLMSNGALIVFDKIGAQMVKYQKFSFRTNRRAILDNDGPNTKYYIGNYGSGVMPMSRECFASPNWSR